MANIDTLVIIIWYNITNHWQRLMIEKRVIQDIDR